ncbi:MAG: hypothetical protein J0I29_00820 [Rhizobiales bacterium]|nr:hypothetical protein [Hyphomicrobiales bacterium]
MIAAWSEWKRYPKIARGEALVAPAGPGIFEVRHVSSGALFAFADTGNLAEALSNLAFGSKSLLSFFGRRNPLALPDLEFRTLSTASRADAKIAAERVIGRREAYMSSVA